eukprot:UN02060
MKLPSQQKMQKKHQTKKHPKVAKKAPKKQQKRSMATVVTQRTLPGAIPLLHPSVQQIPSVVASKQHGRDISALQTHEDQYLLSSVLEPNTYVPKMVLSNNLDQAKAHTRSLYRKVLRILPALCKQYEMMELHPKELVPVIRAHFKKHGEVTSYQVMDALRWEAEVEFSDVVRMFHTQTNVFSMLFPDMHHAGLPRLPPAAAAVGTIAQDQLELQHNATSFLQTFLDPSLPTRQARERLPQYHNV